MFKLFCLVFAILVALLSADNSFICTDPPQPQGDKEKILVSLNSTTGGPYTYSQSGHHFYGTGYDGSYIDTYGCC